ncbi:MAG: glycosyltransferase family 2 protein [Chitinophagales bacterium]
MTIEQEMLTPKQHTTPHVSVVVPLYNEEGNAAELHAEIVQACKGQGYVYEIIMVDDGSSDRSVEIASQLSPIKLIKFRRNFGQTAAMDAGIKAAQYDYIVTMDGDRQNDPNDIPKLIQKLENDHLDVVSGWRKNRKDSFMKNFVSRGANFLRKVLINDKIHDSGCSLKIYRKECFDTISLYGEMHRFIPALLEIKGFKVGEEVVNHRARVAGITKYNWKRTVKGFVDMVAVWFWNKYAKRPLHLLGGLGMVMLGLSFVSGVMTLVKFFQGLGMSESAYPLLTVFLFLGGVQFFVSGLLADIMIKSYFETTKDAVYTIEKVIEN